MLEKIKKFGWGYILIAVFLIAVGACFISFSNVLDILAISIGIILIVYSIIFGIATLARRGRGAVFAIKIALTVIFLVAGTVTVIFGDSAVTVIADIFCLLLILDGAFKLQTSIFSKRYSVRAWWILPIFSVTVIVTSFILTKIQFSAEKRDILSILLGIVIITDGISNLISAFFHYLNEKKLRESLSSDKGATANEESKEK